MPLLSSSWRVFTYPILLFLCASPIYTENSENNALSTEVSNAVKIAIEYYNHTMTLYDHIQSFTKYYDGNNPEFLIAKNRILPVILKEALELLEKVEFDVKTKNRFDTNKIIKIEDQLGDYKTFMRNDSLVTNMRASENLEKHWERLFHEFTKWTQLQASLMEVYEVLKKDGIRLSPENSGSFCMVAKDEYISKMPKSSNFKKGNIHDPEIDEFFRSKGDIPLQTSQEIQALERYLNFGEIDPVSKGLLEGFFPSVNSKCYEIAKKMVGIETMVEEVTDSSQTYANYVIDLREGKARVQELKRKYFEKDEL